MRSAPALLALLLLCSQGGSVGAQADAWSFVERFRGNLEAAGPFSARFVQHFLPEGFSTPETESGRMFLSLPECLRWDYDDPFPKSFILCGDVFHYWHPGDSEGHREEIEARDQPGLDILLLDMAELRSRYSIVESEKSAEQVEIVLRPLASNEFASEATLVLDASLNRLLVSRYGMIAFASSLDQGGPMARSAEDLALVLDVMVGFDSRDSTSLERPSEAFTRLLDEPLSGLRIGLPKEYFAEGMSSDVRNTVEAALAEYRKLGATTVDIELPASDLSVAAYYVIAPAEASSNLSRYDGVRYGFRAEDYSDLLDMYCKTRSQGFGAEVKRRILIGTYVLSHGYYDAFYLKAQRIRRLIARDFAQAFERCDVIMSPTSPTTAFGFGSKTADPVQMYLSDIYTIAANLAGLPGMSIPCGFDDSDLPVGLQIIGNYFSEAKMLNVAHCYQQHTDWHLRKSPVAAS